MAAPDSIRQFAYLNEHDVCLVSRGLSLSRMIAAFVGIQVIMERSYGALHLLRVLLSHATGSHTGTFSGNGSDGSKSRSQSYSPFSADIRNLYPPNIRDTAGSNEPPNKSFNAWIFWISPI